MTLHLYNTLTRKKELFRNRDAGEVKLFTCGPSIYSKPHIGNYATYLFEDVLERYLEYLGYEVRRLINFTDVEDKAVEEAQRQGLTLTELTQPNAELFIKESGLLRIKLPERIPRASASVDQAVRLIRQLMDQGIAYRHDKDIFFDPLKYKGFGRLYGLDMNRWPKKKVRFRKDTYPGQRWNLGDFILWHGFRPDHDERFYWDTEIGKGRPSWNIQDPAIITKHLGFQVDIACGGTDNLYRHHDYLLAIMESISGETFARYWAHAAPVLSGGTKMSKSRGNIVYLQDLLDRGYDPRQIRFYLIYGRYRERIDFNMEAVEQAAQKLGRLWGLAQQIKDAREDRIRSNRDLSPLAEELAGSFEERMNDDLDVKGALDNLFRILSGRQDDGRGENGDVRRVLKRIDGVLQVIG